MKQGLDLTRLAQVAHVAKHLKLGFDIPNVCFSMMLGRLLWENNYRDINDVGINGILDTQSVTDVSQAEYDNAVLITYPPNQNPENIQWTSLVLPMEKLNRSASATFYKTACLQKTPYPKHEGEMVVDQERFMSENGIDRDPGKAEQQLWKIVCGMVGEGNPNYCSTTYLQSTPGILQG